MPACPTCGKTPPPDARFCPDDGTPLSATVVVPGPPAAPTNTGPALALPAVVGGRYQLLEVRGGGGMATVYRAIDQTLEREVAVKLINPNLRAEPEFDARFRREARIASRLSDPHIAVVHDFGIDADHGPFLVMEYLQGNSLREHLLSRGPLALPAVLQLGVQVLLALTHAHEHGVVHRDLKPENVFLLTQGGVRLHVRVLDFGIARIYRDDGRPPGPALTQPGAVVGTPKYMAPEQLTGMPADPRSDIYTAGVVLFEALTGVLPAAAGQRLCELCSDASPQLQDLVEQCLRPNPDNRPASAAEVYLRLHELGKASGILLLSPSTLKQLTARFEPVARPPEVSRRRWWPFIVAGVVAQRSPWWR